MKRFVPGMKLFVASLTVAIVAAIIGAHDLWVGHSRHPIIAAVLMGVITILTSCAVTQMAYMWKDGERAWRRLYDSLESDTVLRSREQELMVQLS